MKTGRICASVVIGLFVCASSASAALISIDDFSDGSTSLDVWDSNPNASDSDGSLAGVIGGQRDVALLWQAGTSDGTVRINDRGTAGVVLFAAGPATEAQATLSYGQAGDLDTDLTDGGNNEGIQLVFNTADLAGTLTITVETAGVGTSVWSGPTPSGLNDVALPAGIFDVPLVDFAGGASFTDVDAITLELAGAASGDYIITRISAVPQGYVPEPMAAAMMAVGGGLVLLRRRSIHRRGRMN